MVKGDTKPYSVADARSLVFDAERSPAEPLTEAGWRGQQNSYRLVFKLAVLPGA